MSRSEADEMLEQKNFYSVQLSRIKGSKQ